MYHPHPGHATLEDVDTSPHEVYSHHMKYLMLASILLTIACATSPSRGIRAEFKGQNTQKVTLVSVFPSSTFGLDVSERDTLTQAVATHALRWFADRRVSMVSNIEVERNLRHQGHLEETRDALRNLSLDQAFEIQHPAHLRGQEIDLVKTTPSPVLNSAPLLFLEIVYYTEGSCRLVASGDHVVRLRSMDTSSCMVAHLHAKLVAPRTAEIMWQNHILLEDTANPSPQTREVHLQRSIDHLFGGHHGLLALLKTPPLQ